MHGLFHSRRWWRGPVFAQLHSGQRRSYIIRTYTPTFQRHIKTKRIILGIHNTVCTPFAITRAHHKPRITHSAPEAVKIHSLATNTRGNQLLFHASSLSPIVASSR